MPRVLVYVVRRLAAFLLLALAVVPAPALAASSSKKSIWGPVEYNGQPQFPIYHDLGVGIWQAQLNWDQVAFTRPANPSDPGSPAYRWPAELDQGIAAAQSYGMRVCIQITNAPAWANGGHGVAWAPKRPSDFAQFAAAAARRYPTVHLWMIWGEPSRAGAFMPLKHERRGHPLNRRERRAPERYARILDAAYGALKSVSRRNLVIGGNTFTTGDISPLHWIQWLRLPNGRRPRMDLYGHNPFTWRKPDLSKPPLGLGFADFSDLDTLSHWLDRYLPQRHGRKLRLFLSEFTIPTDHRNREFNFYVTRPTQASWVAAALRIARHWRRIYTLGWIHLYDEPPNGPGGRPGNEVDGGLMTWDGRPKPAFYAFKRG